MRPETWYSEAQAVHDFLTHVWQKPGRGSSQICMAPTPELVHADLAMLGTVMEEEERLSDYEDPQSTVRRYEGTPAYGMACCLVLCCVPGHSTPEQPTV